MFESRRARHLIHGLFTALFLSGFSHRATIAAVPRTADFFTAKPSPRYQQFCMDFHQSLDSAPPWHQKTIARPAGLQARQITRLRYRDFSSRSWPLTALKKPKETGQNAQ